MTMLDALISQQETSGLVDTPANMDVAAFSEAKQYSFFQINQLLHRYLNKRNLNKVDVSSKNTSSRKKHTVRYKANPSLSFPSSDIQDIRLWIESDKEFAEVVVNFMGLFGPSSPLPAFFTERILHAEPGDTSVQDFLDLFNHRILDLLQRVWEKYRYYQVYERGQDEFSRSMFALVGITHIELCEFSDLQWSRLMPYAGLIAMKVTNVEKVSRVIEGYFNIEGVDIEQCVLREVQVNSDQINQMGIINCEMGSDLVLGESVQDRMGKIRINLRNLTVAQFGEFLPGGVMNSPLKQLVKFLMTDQFDVEIRLQASGKLHLQSNMDGEHAMMGWNTCLGEPVDDEVYDAIL